MLLVLDLVSSFILTIEPSRPVVKSSTSFIHIQKRLSSSREKGNTKSGDSMSDLHSPCQSSLSVHTTNPTDLYDIEWSLNYPLIQQQQSQDILNLFNSSTPKLTKTSSSTKRSSHHVPVKPSVLIPGLLIVYDKLINPTIIQIFILQINIYSPNIIKRSLLIDYTGTHLTKVCSIHSALML